MKNGNASFWVKLLEAPTSLRVQEPLWSQKMWKSPFNQEETVLTRILPLFAFAQTVHLLSCSDWNPPDPVSKVQYEDALQNSVLKAAEGSRVPAWWHFEHLF